MFAALWEPPEAREEALVSAVSAVVDQYHEIKSATKAAAAGLGELQAVTIRLRGSLTEPSSPRSPGDKAAGVKLGAVLDSGGDEEQRTLELNITNEEEQIQAELRLPDGSTATLTRPAGGADASTSAATLTLDGTQCAIISAGHDKAREITYARDDGSDTRVVLTPAVTAKGITSTVANVVSLGAFCCTGDVSSTIYNAKRVTSSGQSSTIGRAVVDQSRGRPRMLVLSVNDGDDPLSKLDMLLVGFYLAADLTSASLPAKPPLNSRVSRGT